MIDTIRQLAALHSIDYTGIAHIAEYKDKIRATSGGFYTHYNHAIAIGIDLLDSIVELLGNRECYENCFTYLKHYDETNERLNHASSVIASSIQKNGYEVIWIPAAERVDRARAYGSISHKFSARLAGFGWIGKNSLLINPGHGPRVRWTTILTNAPLPAENKIEGSRCGECRECVDACPVGALKNREFDENEAREVRFDFTKCEKYYDSLENSGKPRVCGMCMAACPFGKKTIKIT
jgi:epoxyqueuosine reductase QueG